jgi:hypothetical protein
MPGYFRGPSRFPNPNGQSCAARDRRRRLGRGSSKTRRTRSWPWGIEKLAGEIGDLRGATVGRRALTRIFAGQPKEIGSEISILRILGLVCMHASSALEAVLTR